MDAWTYEDLQAKKTELIANMAVVSDMARSRAAARIELLDELMERIKPKPAEQEYYILYKVEWQPEFEGQDAPMDRDHGLTHIDDRITRYSMIAIGADYEIAAAANKCQQERDPLYR